MFINPMLGKKQRGKVLKDFTWFGKQNVEEFDYLQSFTSFFLSFSLSFLHISGFHPFCSQNMHATQS